MAGVQRVALLVKRWILETHPGSIQTGQLVAYLEEFCLQLQPPRFGLARYVALRFAFAGSAQSRDVEAAVHEHALAGNVARLITA